MGQRTLGLFDLPNEILVSLLTTFPTKELLQLILVCHRFHHIVLRILHFRLLVAAEAPEYKIILEAYLPSRRYTRPYLFCSYLGTDGLSSTIEGEGSLYRDCEGAVGGRLAKLSGLYSRFRPEYPAETGQMPVRRIAGAVPNLASNTAASDWRQTNAPSFDPRPARAPAADTNVDADVDVDAGAQQILQTQPIYGDTGDGGSRKVIYTLNLDADELFGQFCSVVSLVKLGPRRGVFLSTVPLLQDRQGVMRVWRQWLLDRAKMLIDAELNPVNSELRKTPTDLRPEDILRDKSVIWTDSSRNVGLRLAIREQPILGVDPDGDKDDLPLMFDLEIQELVVRTTHLMLAVEESQQLAAAPVSYAVIPNHFYHGWSDLEDDFLEKQGSNSSNNQSFNSSDTAPHLDR